MMHHQRKGLGIAPPTIIDSDDYTASGIETLTFPGGEPHVKLPFFNGKVLLVLKLRTWEDIGFGAEVIDALSRQESVTRLIVFIPYFPGARQDRSDGRSPLTVALMGRLLNGEGIRLFIFDPHSKALYSHVQAAVYAVLMPWDLPAVSAYRAVSGIIVPDAGAYDRARGFQQAFYQGSHLLQCTKKRDSQTGDLILQSIPKIPEKGHYILVDDICDGGRTFNQIMEAFAHDPLAPSCSFELFVSHGIFSRGIGNLNPMLEQITTTDSWCRLTDPRLTVIPLANLYDRLL